MENNILKSDFTNNQSNEPRNLNENLKMVSRRTVAKYLKRKFASNQCKSESVINHNLDDLANQETIFKKLDSPVEISTNVNDVMMPVNPVNEIIKCAFEGNRALPEAFEKFNQVTNIPTSLIPEVLSSRLSESIDKQEREIAYNLLTRKIIDETLDRNLVYSHQPKEVLSQLTNILQRNFPEFENTKHTTKIRGYLKACRRSSKKNGGNITIKANGAGSSSCLSSGPSYRLMLRMYEAEKESIADIKKKNLTLTSSNPELISSSTNNPIPYPFLTYINNLANENNITKSCANDQLQPKLTPIPLMNSTNKNSILANLILQNKSNSQVNSANSNFIGQNNQTIPLVLQNNPINNNTNNGNNNNCNNFLANNLPNLPFILNGNFSLLNQQIQASNNVPSPLSSSSTSPLSSIPKLSENINLDSDIQKLVSKSFVNNLKEAIKNLTNLVDILEKFQ